MIDSGKDMPGSTLMAGSEQDVQEQGSIQLSRLSSVLNGLEGGAQVMQRHLQQTLGAIKAGSYRVDPLQISRRIVSEALRMV